MLRRRDAFEGQRNALLEDKKDLQKRLDTLLEEVREVEAKLEVFMPERERRAVRWQYWEQPPSADACRMLSSHSPNAELSCKPTRNTGPRRKRLPRSSGLKRRRHSRGSRMSLE
jgi:hypothetical protein